MWAYSKSVDTIFKAVKVHTGIDLTAKENVLRKSIASFNVTLQWQLNVFITEMLPFQIENSCESGLKKDSYHQSLKLINIAVLMLLILLMLTC